MTFRARKNRVLAALETGEAALGMQFNTGDPSLVEILGATGFDFYMLCMEHSRIGLERMEQCARAADGAGITTLVRVAENNPSLIRHCVEAGAQGIVVPHIASREDARRAVASVRYPPAGQCGMCPAVRAAGYSVADWDDYLAHSSRETMVILLLEGKEAVERSEEILAELRPGIDAAGLGTGDLAQELARPGEKVRFDHPYFAEAYAKVTAVAKRMGIALMDMVKPGSQQMSVEALLERGARILLYSVDQLLFYQMCRDIVRTVKAKQ